MCEDTLREMNSLFSRERPLLPTRLHPGRARVQGLVQQAALYVSQSNGSGRSVQRPPQLPPHLHLARRAFVLPLPARFHQGRDGPVGQLVAQFPVGLEPCSTNKIVD